MLFKRLKRVSLFKFFVKYWAFYRLFIHWIRLLSHLTWCFIIKDKPLNLGDNIAVKLVRHTLNKKTLFNEFLPSLRENVFHFTTSSNWIEIKKSEQVQANINGKFGYRSVHSHESMGNHLRAICLFDLREKSGNYMTEGTIFHDYFNRRIKNKPVYFLVLNLNLNPSILTIKEIDKQFIEGKMYIPDIESWYIGNLNLTKIAVVHEVQLIDG